ncbi:hypothetical protein G6O45_26500, partial [Salmonella enterica subsp. enterica serovar Istanbul]|nr:hypothetical protein [Salmonella enterica subsp. enterica serovar Istanbul]
VYDTREVSVVARFDDSPGAIARTADGHFLRLVGDGVERDGELVLELDHVVDLATFDVHGGQLAIVDDDGVLSVWRLGDAPSLVARHALSELDWSREVVK